MQKQGRIRRYTDRELAGMRARGESKTDWKRSARTTYAEVERQIADDPDEVGMVVDWASASAEMPRPKAVLNMRVDQDVLDYFRKHGRGYQTRINAVLRAFMTAQRTQPNNTRGHKSAMR